MSNINLTKKEVAVRQLNTAIQLFFQSGDPVSVHTLASAAYEILEVLTRGARDFDVLLEAACIRPEKKEEVKELFKKAQNFFKHAGKDASKTLEFVPFQTEIALFDCVHMYGHLTGQATAETHIYNIWFLMRYPIYFNYHRDPNDPLFKLYAASRGAGLNPERLQAFGEIIPILQQSGLCPITIPKTHKILEIRN